MGAQEQDPVALAELCRQYWKPLYIYARYKGSSPSDAEDLTQGFFAHILAKDLFEKAQPQRGKLRALLLSSFQNFMASAKKRERTQKRGSGIPPITFDALPTEASLTIELAENLTPELEYERSWAREILSEARKKLQQDYAEIGKQAEFEAFADQLELGKSEESYREIAAELGVDEAAARYIGFKLRQRFRETIEVIVADTVLTAEDAAEEMSHLMKIFKTP